MDPRPLRCEREHLPVLADGFVELALALVGFAGRLMQPDRIGRDAREPDGLQVRVVPEESPGVVQHFGIVRIKSAELERHGDGIPVAIEIGVRALQVKTCHPAERRVGRLVERLFQPRERFLVSSDLRQRHREQRADVRQRRLQLQRFLQRRDSVGKPALLEVDEAQPRVDLGDTGLKLAHARVGLLGLGVTTLGERTFTLFVQGLHLGRISREELSPAEFRRWRQVRSGRESGWPRRSEGGY